MANDSFYLHMDPAYRHLLNLKDQAEKENASADIKSEISKVIDLFQAREKFCEQQTTALTPGVQTIIEETRSHPWQKVYDEGKSLYKVSTRMLSGMLEDQFLKSLASIGNVKTVLELGLFTGGSALSIAEALPEDGKIYSCEVDPYIADVARSFLDQSAVGKKVQIMLGPANESMSKLAEKKMQFDMIFIDADKPSYSEYYKLVFEYGLLATRGTIVVDNVLYQGYPYCHEQSSNNDNGPAIEKFNELVMQDDNVHRVLLPIRDGIMLIRRKTDVG